MRNVTVAAVQMACTLDDRENLEKAKAKVREAARQGAQIVLLQELFERLYFCQKEKPEFYTYAETVEDCVALRELSALAGELGVVLPVSFYEKSGNALFNSLAMLDADGTNLGVYRKSHIPDGPGYEEKFYFSPGDTGFRVFQTRYGVVGAGICWDQWFPEAARCMALMGAELIFYPTAIGSEPQDAQLDSMPHWRRCMMGHAAANLVPVIAANRVGTERIDDSQITFYGSSFLTDCRGELLAQANRTEETILYAAYDLDANAAKRLEWGLFRDRRPELYRPILSLDGK